jgi:HlyD family secretion protein
MKRIAAVLLVLVALLSAMLAVRLRGQEAAARGPSGGSGEIEGTTVEVSARLTARILRTHVREGQEVRKGDLLMELDCADQLAAEREASARLASSRAQLEGAQAAVAAATRSRGAAAVQELAALAQARALAAERDAAARQAARLDSMPENVTIATRDQTRAGAEGAVRRTEAAEAQARAAAEQVHVAGGTLRGAEAQVLAADAQVRQNEAALERAALLAAECRVVAPRDAHVELLPHEPGELVAFGQTLVKLVDLAEVKATFYLPNAEVAAARPGGPAEVVADAFPGEIFRGTIRTIAARAEFTPRNIQTRTDRDRLVYPVEVWFANPDHKLRPGMPVQVQLVGTSR